MIHVVDIGSFVIEVYIGVKHFLEEQIFVFVFTRKLHFTVLVCMYQC
jgi:hypothetical protein